LRYRNAKQAFLSFDKELLKKEILLRGITQEEWNDFFIRGYVSQGTGKDLKT